MEPGSVSVERIVAATRGSVGWALGLIAVSEEFTTPVLCAGLVTPMPFRKIVTVDPGGAGFAQLFSVPSAFNAKG